MSKPNLAALLTVVVVVILTLIEATGIGEDVAIVGLLSGITYLLLLHRLELDDARKEKTNGE